MRHGEAQRKCWLNTKVHTVHRLIQKACLSQIRFSAPYLCIRAAGRGYRHIIKTRCKYTDHLEHLFLAPTRRPFLSANTDHLPMTVITFEHHRNALNPTASHFFMRPQVIQRAERQLCRTECTTYRPACIGHRACLHDAKPGPAAPSCCTVYRRPANQPIPKRATWFRRVNYGSDYDLP